MSQHNLMLRTIIDSVVSLVESVFVYDLGSPGFNLTVGICAFTWILVARVFMAVFSSKRGIVAAICGLAVPVALGLFAYGLAKLQVVPLVKQDWADSVIPWVAFGLLVYLAILVFVKHIWDLSAGACIVIYLIATSAAIGAYFGAEVTMGVVDFGEQQIEQRDQRTKEKIDSLL